MNNVFVYCEIEGTTVADVSLELLTKGRKLANQFDNQSFHILVASCHGLAFFCLEDDVFNLLHFGGRA